MTKKTGAFWVGQRVKYAGKTVEIIGDVGSADEPKSWRLKIRNVETGCEILAIPTLIKPINTRPSARRGRVYLGQVVQEFERARKEAETLEERILT